tara:strand:- start:1046 stop:1237 length:192 start_codon:yes stop_codon:yes gene_type:complete
VQRRSLPLSLAGIVRYSVNDIIANGDGNGGKRGVRNDAARLARIDRRLKDNACQTPIPTLVLH